MPGLKNFDIFDHFLVIEDKEVYQIGTIFRSNMLGRGSSAAEPNNKVIEGRTDEEKSLKLNFRQ